MREAGQVDRMAGVPGLLQITRKNIEGSRTKKGGIDRSRTWIVRDGSGGRAHAR